MSARRVVVTSLIRNTITLEIPEGHDLPEGALAEVEDVVRAEVRDLFAATPSDIADGANSTLEVNVKAVVEEVPE